MLGIFFLWNLFKVPFDNFKTRVEMIKEEKDW